MHGALTGAYDIAHLAVRNRVVVTNKTPTGLVRGFGGPQVYFALERLFDRIAVELRHRSGRAAAAQLRARRPVPVHRRSRLRCSTPATISDSPRWRSLRRRQAGLRRTRSAASRARRASCTASAIAAIVEPSISNMGYISAVLTPAQRAKAGPKNGGIASATVAIDLLGGVNVTIASAPAGPGTHDGVRAGRRRRARPRARPGRRQRRVRQREGCVVGRGRQLQQPLRRRGRGHGASRRDARCATRSPRSRRSSSTCDVDGRRASTTGRSVSRRSPTRAAVHARSPRARTGRPR